MQVVDLHVMFPESRNHKTWVRLSGLSCDITPGKWPRPTGASVNLFREMTIPETRNGLNPHGEGSGHSDVVTQHKRRDDSVRSHDM